jgi:hypothetical protein
MKRSLGVCGVLALCLILAAPSAAQESASEAFETGRTLLQKCGGDAASQSRCLSYIEGVADAMRLEQAYRRTFFGARVCINQNILSREIKDIVVRWLKDHPDRQRYPASQLIAQAVFKAFPCVR